MSVSDFLRNVTPGVYVLGRTDCPCWKQSRLRPSERGRNQVPGIDGRLVSFVDSPLVGSSLCRENAVSGVLDVSPAECRENTLCVVWMRHLSVSNQSGGLWLGQGDGR